MLCLYSLLQIAKLVTFDPDWQGLTYMHAWVNNTILLMLIIVVAVKAG